MIKATLLPEELFSKIFNHIDSVEQLAQCRITCTKWNRPAETIMFSKTILFKSQVQVLMLFSHLFKDTSKGKLIKRIHFDPEFDTFWLLKAMFDTVPMPNLEYLTGSMMKEDFFTTLLGTATESTTTFNQLKMIPDPTVVTQTYCNALFMFKDTLSTVTLRHTHYFTHEIISIFANRLDKFKNLTKFRVYGGFRQLSHLDLLLKRCDHLKQLSLGVWVENQAIAETNLRSWMSTNVMKSNSLQGLKIYYECQCDFIEYLTYKYPNLNDVNISLTSYRRMNVNDITDFGRIMDRIMNSIKKIPSKNLRIRIPHNSNFLGIIDYFRVHDCKINIVPDSYEEFYFTIEGI